MKLKPQGREELPSRGTEYGHVCVGWQQLPGWVRVRVRVRARVRVYLALTLTLTLTPVHPPCEIPLHR